MKFGYELENSMLWCRKLCPIIVSMYRANLHTLPNTVTVKTFFHQTSSKNTSMFEILVIIIITNPLTARVVRAPQMILQPVFSIFPCSPLPSGTCRTPGLSVPWCCLFLHTSKNCYYLRLCSIPFKWHV